MEQVLEHKEEEVPKNSILNYTSGHTSANIMEVEEVTKEVPPHKNPEMLASKSIKKEDDHLFVTASENFPSEERVPTKHSPPSHDQNFLEGNNSACHGDIRYSNMMVKNSIFTGAALRKESGNTSQSP